MAYRDFTLESVVRTFQLQVQSLLLFEHTPKQELSSWLSQILKFGKRIALVSGNEKARSEFIIAPILLEVQQSYGHRIGIYSGQNLCADPENGLTGECDFILTKGEPTPVISSPIFAMVEAKKADIDGGLGQCVAQMIGAQRLLQETLLNSQTRGETIYGCVTTGEDWQFLKLTAKILTIDGDRYYINQVEKIVGCLRAIVEEALTTDPKHPEE